MYLRKCSATTSRRYQARGLTPPGEIQRHASSRSANTLNKLTLG